MLEKGILIFALGHPYYGRYAFNLAVSIKAVEDIPVCVVHGPASLSHLSDDQLSIFDHKIFSELPARCSAKLHAYELSPFENTLLLDADMVWLPKQTPSQLFVELKGTPFTGITEGSTEKPSSHYFFWAEVDEIRKTYNIEGVIHQWRTEVLYFQRSEKVESMFKNAIRIYRNHGLTKVKSFAEGVPDELAINIAAAIEAISPHKENWQPSYWAQIHKNQLPGRTALFDNYYTLSLGGNHTTDNVKRCYNDIMIVQSQKLGLTHSFPAQSKYNFLKERQKS